MFFKKFKKILIAPISAFFLSLSLISCNSNINPEEKLGEMVGVAFEGVNSIEGEELDNFIKRAKKDDGTWNNDEAPYSVIVSPFYQISLSKDATNIPTYAANVTKGVHSFATIKCDGKINHSIKIHHESTIIKARIESPSVNNIPYSIMGKDLYITISDYGTYTIVLNENYSKPLSLFVEHKITFDSYKENFKGYQVVDVEPGNHEDVFNLNQSDKLYRFKKGVHFIKRFDFNVNNVAIYFEEGSHIVPNVPTLENEPNPRLNPDWAGKIRYKEMFNAYDTQGLTNLAVGGTALIDLSKLPWHARIAFRFRNTTNIKLDDLLVTDPVEWTFYIDNSKDVAINNVKVIGFRQNSDGFIVNSSKDVTVDNCFCRSGDDLFEVKANWGARNEEERTNTFAVKNVSFTNCTAWPDKTRPFGIIAEIHSNVYNVLFDHCLSIGSTGDTAEFNPDSGGTQQPTVMGAMTVYIYEPYYKVEKDKTLYATVDGVTFSNMKFVNYLAYAVHLNIMHYHTDDNHIKNINFENIYFENTTSSLISKTIKMFCVKDFEDHTNLNNSIENVTFKNFNFNYSEITNEYNKFELTNVSKDTIKVFSRLYDNGN